MSPSVSTIYTPLPMMQIVYGVPKEGKLGVGDAPKLSEISLALREWNEKQVGNYLPKMKHLAEFSFIGQIIDRRA